MAETRDLDELDAALGKTKLDVLVDFIGALNSLDLDDTTLLVKVLDNGHAGLDKGSETLANALLIVVSSAAGLATVEQTLLHDVLGALEKQGKDTLADGLFELNGLVHFAGEAVDKELVDAFVLDGCLHGVLEQLDGDLHGDNLAVADVLLDQVAKVGSLTVLLFTQQITGREVLELVVADNVAALGALASAGTTKDKDDNGLAVSITSGKERLVAGHGRNGREVGGSHFLVFGMDVGVELFLGWGTLVSGRKDVVGFALAFSRL